MNELAGKSQHDLIVKEVRNLTAELALAMAENFVLKQRVSDLTRMLIQQYKIVEEIKEAVENVGEI